MLAQEIEWKQLATVAIIGALVGVITFALGVVLKEYALEPIGCQAQNTIIHCDDATVISHNIALLLGAIIGLTFLVRRAVYRPLLIVLATVVSLWGVVASLSSTYWLIALGLTTLMFALCYSLFTWVSVFRRFWISLVVVAVVTLVLRVAFLV